MYPRISDQNIGVLNVWCRESIGALVEYVPAAVGYLHKLVTINILRPVTPARLSNFYYYISIFHQPYIFFHVGKICKLFDKYFNTNILVDSKAQDTWYVSSHLYSMLHQLTCTLHRRISLYLFGSLTIFFNNQLSCYVSTYLPSSLILSTQQTPEIINI